MTNPYTKPTIDTATLKPGVSLSQDAWRKLRRNRLAMLSLVTLISVAVLAMLTPLLPLAPPDRDQTKLKLSPPSGPLLVTQSTTEDGKRHPDAFGLRQERIDELYERELKAREQLSEAEQSYERALEATSSDDVEKAKQQVKRAMDRVEDLQQRPYQELGYPKLGPISRAMLRARMHLFGDVTIGPIAGRDKLGRDILSRVFWGARVSLIVGIVATLVSLVIGVTYGAVSGYVGGWVDDLMMRIVDVGYSIPFIFVVIFLITVLSEDSVKETLLSYGIDRITIFYLVVGAIYWLTMSRVVRGQVLSLKNELFVEAARSIGASQLSIIFKHIVPNLFSVVIVYITLTIPRVILFEAFLSFLGLGVEPPDVSWGLLANEGIQVITPVRIYWWLILFPSLAIGMTLFALNFLGDGLRDAFDPRLRDQ